MDPAPSAAPRRALDHTPLTQRVGLGARLRAVAGNNVLVIGLTVATLVAAVPAVVLLVLLVARIPASGGAIGCLVLFMVGGAYAVVDGLGQAAGASALQRFAEVNDLEWIGGTTVTHYAAASFADGSHLVAQAVRTRDHLFVEVGDRFPTTSPPADAINTAEVYLRWRLAARQWAPVDGAVLVGDLAERLRAFAGEWTVDVTYDEVTVTGSRPLRAEEAGRVAEAFALVDALALRAAALLGGPAETSRSRRRAAEDLSGVRVPPPPRAVEPGRPRPVVRTVALTLAVLVVLPLGFAAVMSQVDDGLRGNALGATVAVSLLVALAFAVVKLLIRSSVTPRGRRRRR